MDPASIFQMPDMDGRDARVARPPVRARSERGSLDSLPGGSDS